MKRISIMLAALFALTLNINALRNFELPLWEGNDLTDDAADARIYVYLADNPTGQAVIACPGGAYVGLAMDNEGNWFAPLFNQAGISTIVLKYRLPKQRPDIPLKDAEQAMRIVRNHAKEWNIDPNNVGIMGGSAGGHLASTLATHYSSKDTRPDFQILLYPVTSLDEKYQPSSQIIIKNLIGPNKPDEVEKYNNVKHVNKDTPTAFIVLSAEDTIVPIENSLLYAQALIDNGVQVSLHMYPGGFHGFGCWDEFKDAAIWKKELIRWMKKYYK